MKFFVATMELRQVVQIQVAALDERAAEEAAKEQARQAHGAHSQVVSVDLSLRGESAFDPGTRVVHRIFGPGTVTEMQGCYGASNGARITVQFDRGDIKQLHAPHPSLLPESLVADATKSDLPEAAT
jgi:hypothetical protein